jgi:hypothetical protein
VITTDTQRLLWIWIAWTLGCRALDIYGSDCTLRRRISTFWLSISCWQWPARRLRGGVSDRDGEMTIIVSDRLPYDIR